MAGPTSQTFTEPVLALSAIAEGVWAIRFDLAEGDPGRLTTVERLREIEDNIDALLAQLEGEA